jgi:hypothetical protein
MISHCLPMQPAGTGKASKPKRKAKNKPADDTSGLESGDVVVDDTDETFSVSNSVAFAFVVQTVTL